MKDLPWSTKYRPITADEYIDESIRQIIASRFSSKKNQPNVAMIQGESGCGKTAFVKLVSKYYLCVNPGENGTPCESCESCCDINKFFIRSTGIDCSNLGVIEAGASTINNREERKEILEGALAQPIHPYTHQILIFDECHMLSESVQNELVSVIEDAPTHLVVLFVTTKPERVLKTIHSRCQVHVTVSKKNVDELAKRLEYICKKENLTVSWDALRAISNKSDRIARDAINLLEDIAKRNHGVIDISGVQQSAGMIKTELYLNYFESANKSIEDILYSLLLVEKECVSYSDFIRGLNAFISDCLYVKHGLATERFELDFVKSVKKIFKMYKTSEMYLTLQNIEYVSKESGEDEAFNKVLLINFAMRLNRHFYADNYKLFDEVGEAAKENEQALTNHIIKKNIEQQENQQRNDKNDEVTLKDRLGDNCKSVGEFNVVIDVNDVVGGENEDDRYSLSEVEKILGEID